MMVKLRPSRLRTRLLAPIVFLVVIGSACLGAIEEITTSKQIEVLVNQRGATVLGEIVHRLRDRQHAKEVFAQLLANQPQLPMAVAQKRQVDLARILVPLKAKLGLGCIEIYSTDQQQLLELGVKNPVEGSTIEASHKNLVVSTLSGLTQSDAVIENERLAVFAATPIKGAQGIVGVMVVGGILDEEMLKSTEDRNELALFRSGRLVSTTIKETEVIGLLAKSKLRPDELKQLNRDLVRFNLYAVAKVLDNGEFLLALTSTKDLILASEQRKFISLLGISGLVTAVMAIGLLLVRNVAKPLEAMVEATNDIVHGDYAHRIASTDILELNDLAGAINHLSGQVQDQIAKLTYQAFHDSLTNLPNRPLFEDRLHQALSRANRKQGAIAVLFLDLDGFKLINDSLGHKAGDQLLVAVSKRLKESLRDEDTLARLGGDEFAILIENIDDIDDATTIAGRIADQLQPPFHLLDREEVFVTASIGIACNTGSDRSEDFLRNADAAMYEAKKNGKAHYQVFDLNMNSQARRQLMLETELRRAIEREEFRIYYQPIVQLETGRITEVEALIRWEHPDRGLIQPIEFIAIAEATGLIIPIGQWVLETACRQAKTWRLEYPNNPPLVVNVNLSAKQFQQSQLEKTIAQTLKDMGLEPSSLKLEITETGQ